MSAIQRIAFHLGRRDEDPNKELASDLAQKKDHQGVAEIAGFLNDKNPSIASDCIKVLYQVGYQEPELISDYSSEFIQLLGSKNNRMVWGGMIALSTIAEIVPDKIRPFLGEILELIETGTVITNVSGVLTLIGLAKAGDPYYGEVIDDLLRLQEECRPIDFAKRAEVMWEAISPDHQEAYLEILEKRLPSLSNAAQKRLVRVIKKIRNS